MSTVFDDKKDRRKLFLRRRAFLCNLIDYSESIDYGCVFFKRVFDARQSGEEYYNVFIFKVYGDHRLEYRLTRPYVVDLFDVDSVDFETSVTQYRTARLRGLS